jgi:hypothetical protein
MLKSTPKLASNHRERAVCINPPAAFFTINNQRHSLSRSSQLSGGTGEIPSQDSSGQMKAPPSEFPEGGEKLREMDYCRKIRGRKI